MSEGVEAGASVRFSLASLESGFFVGVLLPAFLGWCASGGPFFCAALDGLGLVGDERLDRSGVSGLSDTSLSLLNPEVVSEAESVPISCDTRRSSKRL